LAELARVVKRGGRIYLLAWTAQQVLPGHSLLEARLNADYSSYNPYLKGVDPEQHFLRAPRWFHEAGFQEIQARTFTGSVLAPLSVGERTALTSLFEMLWAEPETAPEVKPGGKPEVGTEPAEDAWSEYQRLSRPGSPDFILDLPGYYAFFTYTLFSAKTPE
jgi:demethylmenaquinone methyltransferase/2-methoxy-6-polyprenyl-1,4-benzoquinol methylase